jgi:acetoin utilization deacetylase AcuC-like enzyme
VNFPLKNGIDDASYLKVFKPIIQEVMDVFRWASSFVLFCVLCCQSVGTDDDVDVVSQSVGTDYADEMDDWRLTKRVAYWQTKLARGRDIALRVRARL